jgi:hypothetical protein
MTPYQAEASGRKAASLPAPVAQAVEAAKVSEEVSEPTKRAPTKAEAPAPTAKKELKDVLKAWGDEE